MSRQDPPRGEWFKSSYSGGADDNCVEIADFGATVGVRDSKDPEGGRLDIKPQRFAAFVAAIKSDEFD